MKRILLALSILAFAAPAGAVPYYGGKWRVVSRLTVFQCAGVTPLNRQTVTLDIKQRGEAISYRRKSDGVLVRGHAHRDSFGMGLFIEITSSLGTYHSTSWNYSFYGIKAGRALYMYEYQDIVNGDICIARFEGKATKLK